MNVLPMCITAGLHILSCLPLLKGQSTFLEVPAMHRKEPASRDVFASEDLTLPCCYATVASSWQKVAQTPRKHTICQELYATGPWFTQPRRSDPLVLANLLRRWQDPRFLTSGIPLHTFQAEFTIFTDTSTQGWGAHMGDSQISGTWTLTDRKLHINCLELKAVSHALQHWAQMLQGHQVMIATDNSTVASYINKQGGTLSLTLLWLTVELLLWLEAQNIIVRARHPRLSERDSRPPISSEPAYTNRVVPTPRDREAYLQGLGDTRSRHVCNTVELPPSSVHVSKSPSSGCSVSGLAGEVNVHVSPIPPAQQSHAVTLIHSGGGGNSRSPLVAVSVVVPTSTTSLCGTPLVLPFRHNLLSQQDQKYISDGKSYHLHVWRLSCDTIKQQAFQTRSLGSQQPLGGPQPIACTMIDSLRSMGCRTRV